MPFPAGLTSKTLTFGRYSSALGNSQKGTIKLGFDQPMLHVPTGEVITAGMESVAIDASTGAVSIAVPVTVTNDLVTNWLSASPVYNQRLRIEISIPGYPQTAQYVDIHPDDPAVMDYDHLAPYSLPGGLTVLRSQHIPLATDVTTPGAGFGALFFDTADSKLKIKLPDGSILSSPAWTV